MHSHPNARLTQRERLRLVIQHLRAGRSLSELAAENGNGISLRGAPCSTVARTLSRLGWAFSGI